MLEIKGTKCDNNRERSWDTEKLEKRLMSRPCHHRLRPYRLRGTKPRSSVLPPMFVWAAACLGIMIAGSHCEKLQAQNPAPRGDAKSPAKKSSNEAIAQYRDGILLYNKAKWGFGSG